jgi:hypothetical protein
MDMYDLLSQQYPGWSLTEITSLSLRERLNWLSRATARVRR